MLRYWLLLLGMLFYSFVSTAKDSCAIFVKLQLTEKHNDNPVPFATVYIKELNTNLQSDEFGIANWEHVCAGNYNVTIKSFETEDASQLIKVEESGTIKIQLQHAANLLHQIVISDKQRQSIIQDKETIYQKTIDAHAGKTISELLTNINGIATLNNGATVSKPVIHGLHSNRILMLNNGVRQEDQQWGAEHAPNIDPFIANNITVLKGAAGVRYGTDAIGGVILVEPKPIRDEAGWAGTINLVGNTNNRMGVVSGIVEHRFAKHPEYAFRLQGTLKRGGNYQIPNRIWVANTGIVEQNFSSTFSYKGIHKGGELFFSRFANVIGIYSGSHTGSQQDFENAINSPIPLVTANFSYNIGRPKQVVAHDLLKIKSYVENKIGVWNFVYAFQHNYRQEYDVVRIDKGEAQLNLSLNTHSLNLNLEHKSFGNFSGQIGVDGLYQHNTFKDGDRVFIPSYYAFSTAAYAIERFSKNNWTAEAGLRFDYKHFDMYNPEGVQLNNVLYQFDYKNPSGTLAFKQKLSERWNWSATLANAWRAPQAPELFSAGLHQGGARIELGDKNLKPEKALSLNLVTQYQIENRLKVDVSLYSQAIQDFIYLKPGADLLTIRGYYKTFNYVQTNALLSGTDISTEYNFTKHLNAEAKVSILRAWDRSQKDWLLLMPSDRYAMGVKYNFDLNKSLHECFLGAHAQYVLQQKRVPKNFSEIDRPFPPAAYFLLNASIGASFVWRKQPIYWSITASNLLNTRYRDYLDLFRYFVDRPGRDIAFRIRIPIH